MASLRNRTGILSNGGIAARSREPQIKLVNPVMEEIAKPIITRRMINKADSESKSLEDKMNVFNLVNTELHFMSWDEIVKLSVCEITNEKMTGDSSLGDLRLGILEPNDICKTCHKSSSLCPGHFGRIKFKHSFPHPLLVKYSIYLLQSVCNCCGALILDKKTIEKTVGGIKDPHLRIKKLAEASITAGICTKFSKSSENKCNLNPKYKMTNSKDTYKIKYTYSTKDNNDNDKTFEQPIETVRKILKSISDDDCKIIGFENGNRPENLILDGLAVMSVQARPYTFQDGERKENFLSSALAEIIKLNNKLDTHCYDNDGGAKKDANIVDLYKQIYWYMDNTQGLYKVQDEPIITIKQKLGGKEGFIREFVSGKRINFCARSVAGPGRLPFGWVGLPEIIREILTVPITVTPYNHKWILKLYHKGEVNNLIYNSSSDTGENKRHKGQLIQIKTTSVDRRFINSIDKYEPHVGDIVEVWLQHGCYAVVNRQPTLHHFGFGAHRACFHKDLNFKNHQSITTGYNLDFDGDEINLVLMQTEMGIAEAKGTCNITSYIMNDQNNRPMMGLVFNSPSSAMLMTDDNMILDQQSWEEAVMMSEIYLNFPERLHSLDERLLSPGVKEYGINRYSGKALFSLLLPENFYYNSGGIKIRNGILVKGKITKDHIGPSSNSIIQYLHKMHTKAELIGFFTHGAYLLDWFISWHGLSVGFSSCIIDDPMKIKNLVEEEMSKAIIQIEALIEPITIEEKQKYEIVVMNILNNVAAIGKNICIKGLPSWNAFFIMATSKAKGNPTNIASMLGLLGQQFIRNKRPVKTLNGGKRSLAHFELNDKSLEASGFVPENYFTGLSPGSEFFTAAASREGLIDTAAGTSVVGAMHRRINKVLEDVFVNYMGCIVDKNTIFQYCWADGFDPKHLLNTKSVATGNVINFIDYLHVIGSLNLERGYDIL